MDPAKEMKNAAKPDKTLRSQRARAKGRVRKWEIPYLNTLRETGYYGRACAAACVSRQTVYERRKKDSDFAQAEAAALDMASRDLIDEAVRRAKDGVRRLVFNPKTGQPYTDPATGGPYYEHQYSDQLLIRLLAARLPDVFGNRAKLEVESTHRRLTLAELEQRMRDAEA